MVITLIGYRGTGKSTVAPALAARLGWDGSVDADTLIEQQAGKSIRDIFAEESEAAFRTLERTVMQELLQRDRQVIAAGGGAILDERTRRELPQAGPVVWLRASVETILSRINDDATSASRRPDLTADGGRTEIEGLLAIREPLYRQAADVIVDTEGLSIGQIVEQIVSQLEPRLREGAAG